MSDYPMLISNKLHSFRNFVLQSYKHFMDKQSFLHFSFPPIINILEINYKFKSSRIKSSFCKSRFIPPISSRCVLWEW